MSDAGSLARRFQSEAVAALASVIRDARTPPAVRASAAAKLLDAAKIAFEDLSVADIELLDEEAFDRVIGVWLQFFRKRGMIDPDDYRLAMAPVRSGVEAEVLASVPLRRRAPAAR